MLPPAATETTPVLVTCCWKHCWLAGVTLRSVATAMGLTLDSASLRADGVFDARGTLGVDRLVPVGVQDIVVTVEIDSDASLERLARSTERYCVVGQSLRESARFVVRRTSGT
jgi:uncharacterized OsmC-like protein